MSATALSNSITVVCSSSNDKIVNKTLISVPSNATIADLKIAMTGSDAKKKKAVQVLVGGAVPSEATLLRDLAAAYAAREDGLLHVSFSVERSFGASFNGNLTDGCAGQC